MSARGERQSRSLRKSWCARRVAAAGTTGSRSSCLRSVRRRSQPLQRRPAGRQAARRLHPRRQYDPRAGELFLAIPHALPLAVAGHRPPGGKGCDGFAFLGGADRSLFHRAASKIAVIPNGREHAFRWSPQHSPVTRAAAGDGTIVVIGSPAPHKTSACSSDWPTTRGVGLKLAIVGSLDGNVFAAGNSAPISGNIAWLGRLTDGEIAALLRDCLCLAFPSFTEGFGLRHSKP